MPKFEDVNDLNWYVRAVIYEALKDIAEKIKRDIDSDLEKMYSATGSEGDYAYKRTKEFLHCVTCSELKFEKGEVSFEVFYDPDKIKAWGYQNGGFWAVHTDKNENKGEIWNGMTVVELLPFWMEYGTEKTKDNKNMHPRAGWYTMEFVHSMYKDTFRIRVKQELKRLGVKVV